MWNKLVLVLMIIYSIRTTESDFVSNIEQFKQLLRSFVKQTSSKDAITHDRIGEQPHATFGEVLHNTDEHDSMKNQVKEKTDTNKTQHIINENSINKIHNKSQDNEIENETIGTNEIFQKLNKTSFDKIENSSISNKVDHYETKHNRSTYNVKTQNKSDVMELDKIQNKTKDYKKPKRRQNIQNPEVFQRRVKALIEKFGTDFTQYWMYKDLYNEPHHIGATYHLVQRAFSNFGDEIRLKHLLIQALKGEKVNLVVIGGSISRGAPFAEQGQGFRIYFNAIRYWWNNMIAPITGSHMYVSSVSIGGVGTDYFSYCLNSHIQEDDSTKLFLWELSANDKGRYSDKPFPPGKPLEQFTRNILQRKSKSPLLYINFFRGHDYNSGRCNNYEDEGGLTVAKHYRITSISWRNFVCESIKAGDPIFSMKTLFSVDKFHPSILGHAQMAFLVINYLRNSFLRMLRHHASKTNSFHQFSQQSHGEMTIAKILYHETSVNKPLCATYFTYNEYQPNNTLVLKIARHDDFHFNIFKQFKVRADKLGGMQTFVSEQLLQLTFMLPKPYSRLVLTTHSDTGSAQVWIDKDTPVLLETQNYHMGTKVELVTTNLLAGNHTLNVLSMKGGFAVCAIAVI